MLQADEERRQSSPERDDLATYLLETVVSVERTLKRERVQKRPCIVQRTQGTKVDIHA